MEVGENNEYIPIATLSPPEWPALRWAAMRAILMFHYLWGSKSQDCVHMHKPQPFWRERRARNGIEPRSFRLPAYHLTARPSAYQALPLGQTGSQKPSYEPHSYLHCLLRTSACLPPVGNYEINLIRFPPKIDILVAQCWRYEPVQKRIFL